MRAYPSQRSVESSREQEDKYAEKVNRFWLVEKTQQSICSSLSLTCKTFRSQSQERFLFPTVSVPKGPNWMKAFMQSAMELWTPFMIMQKCKWDVSLSDFQILRKNSQVCMYFVEPRLSVGRGNSGPLEEWTQEFCSVTLVGLSLKRIVLPNSSMLLT